MTSLIDVIFLLLLFFMLSSTFSRFSDVEMALSAPGGGAAGLDGSAFLRLGADEVDLNGAVLPLDGVVTRLATLEVERLIVSVGHTVSAQRLTDFLVALRDAPDVEIVLLGEG
jgi:biopolymer transport protein ExbD